MKKSKSVVRTKRPMIHFTFRAKTEERIIWRDAATRLGVSLNEFLRLAVREHGRRVLSEVSKAA
jgi:uncharacterized protein (DUF1778 family)